jgi:hypothetical protein
MCNVRNRVVEEWRVLTMNKLCFFCIIILLPIGGCKENGASVTTPPEPMEFRQALIPLAVGNEWTYVDSLFSGETVSVETYTVLVSSFRYDNARAWWQLQERRASSTINLMEIAARNDSIFSLQYNFQSPVSSLDYIPPSPTDTLHFYSLVGGDVIVTKTVWLNGTYSVPAGVFDSCAVFVSLVTPGGFTEILKPRIGIIQREIQYERSWRKVTLTDFQLKR